MQLTESAKEKIRGRTKNKYNIGYALSTHVRADRTRTLVIRVTCNKTFVDYPTLYNITKAQFKDKTFGGTRQELRDEIIAYLDKEMQTIKERLDAYSQDELHSMSSQELYRTAFAQEPRISRTKPKEDIDLRNITTSIYWDEPTKKYVQHVAQKCGYKFVSEFLNEAFFAVLVGAVHAPDFNQMQLKARYMQYLKNPAKFVDILKGKIEKPKKPNKKRYKYDLGF